jgi:lipopolysaccharide export system permease protein
MFLFSKIIAKEWFKSLIGALVVLFILISVGDIINGFLQNYETSRVLIEYLLKLPDLMGKMLPICTLLASLFAINKLKAHSELIAILAGGFSAIRIYQLILLCSIFVGLFQFWNLGYVLPEANRQKRLHFEKSERNESKYLARSRIGTTGLLWYKSNDYFASFNAFDRLNTELKKVSFYYYNSEGKTYKVLKADSARHIENDTWDLINVLVFDELTGPVFPNTERLEKLSLKLNEVPSDFGQFESDITTLTFFNLANFISRLKNTGINSTEYEVILFEKLSLSIICIIFSLFPLVGVFSPNRRASSFGKNVVFTLIFTVVFWVVYSSVIALGNSGKLPPLIATMIIPLFFLIYILMTIRKNRFL